MSAPGLSVPAIPLPPLPAPVRRHTAWPVRRARRRHRRRLGRRGRGCGRLSWRRRFVAVAVAVAVYVAVGVDVLVAVAVGVSVGVFVTVAGPDDVAVGAVTVIACEAMTTSCSSTISTVSADSPGTRIGAEIDHCPSAETVVVTASSSSIRMRTRAKGSAAPLEREAKCFPPVLFPMIRSPSITNGVCVSVGVGAGVSVSVVVEGAFQWLSS